MEHVLQWHPGFQAVLQIELWEERDFLTFCTEYNLTQKPLQIDTLIIKKQKGYQVKKCIGRIFRQYNIIEYKSPNDYLSVNDFYKVIGYACLYQADTVRVMERSPDEITVTLVSNYFPRKLIRHLKRVHQAKVQEQYPGIYYVTGLMFSVQILINRRLSPDETMWLSRLRENLQVKEDVEVLAKAYRGKEKNPLYAAAMELIIQANKKQYEEAKHMCNALRELFADEWEEAEQRMARHQEEMERFQEEVTQYQEEMERFQEEVEQHQEEMARHQEEMEQQKAEMEQQKEEMARHQEEMEQQKAEMEQQKEEMNERQSQLTQFRTSLLTQYAEAILNILKFRGEISEKVRAAILKQDDLYILYHWMELAVRADSVQAFELLIADIPKSA